MAFRSHFMTKELFLKEYDKEQTTAEIAASLGVHTRTVDHWTKKLGLRPHYKSFRHGDMREMVLEHVVGKCLSETELVRELELERFGHGGAKSVPHVVGELEAEGLVRTYSLNFSSNGASFGFYDVFDSSKTRPGKLVYDAGQGFLLGFKIASCLRDDLGSGKRHAIYNRFLKTLPLGAYVALKKYM